MCKPLYICMCHTQMNTPDMSHLTQHRLLFNLQNNGSYQLFYHTRSSACIFLIPSSTLALGRVWIFSKKKLRPHNFFSIISLRPRTGRDHRQGAKPFFRIRLGGEDFFYYKIWKSNILFFKKAVFEDLKVIYVGSSDWSVFIGV